MTTWHDSQFWIDARHHLCRSVRAFRCGAFITCGGETRLFWRGDWYGWQGVTRLYPHALWIDLDVIFNVDSHAASFDAGAGDWGQAA